MALKFLNKKGWHTGSLRNIENVWKAEQKSEAEQRKLEELKKQIQDEREKSEFRVLQEQAGLVPRQERLEFLYESGLAVGKSMDGASSSGGSGVPFKALEEAAPGVAQADGSSSAGKVAATAKDSSSALGALFEDKPHSANDAWRKLHSDPLLLIRQREQDALARIKNNPVQMALIRKSVEVKKEKGKSCEEKGHRRRHKKHKKHSTKKEESDSEDSDALGEKRRRADDPKRSKYDEVRHSGRVYSEDESEKDSQKMKKSQSDSKYRGRSPDWISESKAAKADRIADRRDFDQSKNTKHPPNDRKDPEAVRDEREPRKYRGRSPDWISESKAARDDDRNANRRDFDQRKYSSNDRRDRDNRNANRREFDQPKNTEHPSTDPRDHVASRDEGEPRKFREGSYKSSTMEVHDDSRHKRRNYAPKLSEEERAAKLREMQMDAELHEEQRWKRLKRADEDDAKEAAQPSKLGGKNFLDAAHRSVYGAEKGGSSTIEESVRRRTHYAQRGSGDGNNNAFRR